MSVDSEAFLRRFWFAFNNRDPDAIAAMMTDDAILEASFGKSSWGTRVVGRDAIRAFYVEMFAEIPDAQWSELRRIVSLPHVVVESILTGLARNGAKVETTICDVLTLDGDQIAAKRSYRKAASDA